MSLYDQAELLCQAITSQAKGEEEKILARAREEADRRLNEAEARRQEALARTKAEVEAQAKLSARNRLDRAELENAKGACPGLNPDCRHKDFVEAALNQGKK